MTTSDDRTVKLWDLATGETVLTLRGHSGAVLGLACRPDGSQIATTGSDDARIWDTAASTAAPRRTLAPIEIAAAPVAPTCPGTPRIWPTSVLTGHEDSDQSDRVYAPDGQTVVTVSDDTTIRLWEPATGRPRAVLRGHQAPGDLRGDRSRTAACSQPARATGERPKSPLKSSFGTPLPVPASQAGKPTTGRSGRWRSLPMAARWPRASSDGLVKLWDPADTRRARRPLSPATPVGSRPGIHSRRQNARLLAPGRDPALGFDQSRNHHRSQGPSREITALAIRPDGKILATASRDESVILWDRSMRQTARDRGGQPRLGQRRRVLARRQDARTRSHGRHRSSSGTSQPAESRPSLTCVTVRRSASPSAPTARPSRRVITHS